jgi:hypothetical protein
MGCQLGQVAGLPPALAHSLAPEPGDHPDHMHGCRGQERLEVRARQAKIPTPAEINASDPWREATLYPCWQGVLGVELGGLLPLAGGLDGLVVRWRPDGELPWGVFRRGAQTTGGARATGGPVETATDDRSTRDLVSRPPVDTRMPVRTVGLLRLPIQAQGLQAIALTGLMWPAIRPKSGTDHIHLIVARRRDETVRIHVATVEPVGPRQQITLSQGVVDGGTHDTIRRGGRGGDHWRDQIRRLRITGLREVELRAHPMGVTLTAVAGLQVVGRRDTHRRRRLLILRAPAERFEPGHGTAVIVLQPYLPECLQGGKVAEV